MITICKECKWAERATIGPENSDFTGDCLCPNAPVDDFVMGRKTCHLINADGKCLYFRRLTI